MGTFVDSTTFAYHTRHCSLPLSAASYKGQTGCSSQLPATWNRASSPMPSASMMTAALSCPFLSVLPLSAFLPSFRPLPYPLLSFSFFPLPSSSRTCFIRLIPLSIRKPLFPFFGGELCPA